jgi:hypothetical protein
VLSKYKCKQVVIALNDLVPLFLDCPESLLNNEKFMGLVIGLIQTDRTYVKMAKNLISHDFPGPILKVFANMIEYQLQSSRRFGIILLFA